MLSAAPVVKRWPILLVGLLEIVLFTHSCVRWWQHPAAPSGEGMILRSDGLAYYAWLRSLLIDGDLSFDNEFDEHNIYRDGLPHSHWRTAKGLRVNVQSVGPACVWAPAVVATHGLLAIWPGGSPWPRDGYSLPYQLAVGVSSLATSLMGLWLFYRICRLFTGPMRASLAAAFLALGTMIFYYETFEVSMAHGIGATALAAFLYYWLKSYGSLLMGRWAIVGFWLGVAALMRWQLILFAILPMGECIVQAWRLRADKPWRLFVGLALSGLATCVTLMPQFIAWRTLYGSWLALPHPIQQHWTDPALVQVLWSQDRSLFYWTPITLIGLMGLILHCRGSVPLALMTLAFAAQVYFVASIYGSQLHLGAAYGFRLLTESLVVLAPGLALLLASNRLWSSRLVASICCLLVAWNCLLIAQYRSGMVPGEAGASLSTMLRNVPKVLRSHTHRM